MSSADQIILQKNENRVLLFLVSPSLQVNPSVCPVFPSSSSSSSSRMEWNSNRLINAHSMWAFIFLSAVPFKSIVFVGCCLVGHSRGRRRTKYSQTRRVSVTIFPLSRHVFTPPPLQSRNFPVADQPAIREHYHYMFHGAAWLPVLQYLYTCGGRHDTRSWPRVTTENNRQTAAAARPHLHLRPLLLPLAATNNNIIVSIDTPKTTARRRAYGWWLLFITRLAAAAAGERRKDAQGGTWLNDWLTGMTYETGRGFTEPQNHIHKLDRRAAELRWEGSGSDAVWEDIWDGMRWAREETPKMQVFQFSVNRDLGLNWIPMIDLLGEFAEGDKGAHDRSITDRCRRVSITRGVFDEEKNARERLINQFLLILLLLWRMQQTSLHLRGSSQEKVQQRITINRNCQ